MSATLTTNDDFLIIACDGIWDVLSEEDAISSVRCVKSSWCILNFE
jgi:serine/threonine protein phosphatase PrpC